MTGSGPSRETMRQAVESAEERRLRARRRERDDLWFGLGMFGLVGWSVAVPMLIGLAIGVAIDVRHPGGYAWSLMGLLIGVLLGVANASYWVDRQRREIERERRETMERPLEEDERE